MEIDEYDIALNDDLDEFDKKLNTFHRMDTTQKRRAIEQCEILIRNLEKQIENYELDISELGATMAQRYSVSLKAITQRFRKLKNTLTSFKDQLYNQNALIGNRQEEKQEGLTNKQLITFGHQTQDKSLEVLNQIEVKVEEGKIQADEINKELDRQIERLDAMYTTVKETQTILKSTKKLVAYFQRTLGTDNCLTCLIFLVVVALVICIILAACGKAKNLNLPS